MFISPPPSVKYIKLHRNNLEKLFADAPLGVKIHDGPRGGKFYFSQEGTKIYLDMMSQGVKKAANAINGALSLCKTGIEAFKKSGCQEKCKKAVKNSIKVGKQLYNLKKHWKGLLAHGGIAMASGMAGTGLVHMSNLAHKHKYNKLGEKLYRGAGKLYNVAVNESLKTGETIQKIRNTKSDYIKFYE